MSATRPRVLREVEILARIHTKRAIEILVEVMEDREAPHGARVSAANSVLDRGWGRAPQTVVVDDTPQILDDAGLEAKIRERVATLVGTTGGAGEEGSGAGGSADGAAPQKGSGKSSRVVH